MLAAVAGLYLLDCERGLGRASELITGAGLAAVTGASGIRLLAVLVGFELDAPIAPPSTLSNIALIVVALLLILAGTRFGYHAPTYVGAIGLFIFVIVGLDLRSEDPENSIVGWPLVLLILGAIAFAVSVVPGLRIRLTLERAGGK